MKAYIYDDEWYPVVSYTTELKQGTHGYDNAVEVPDELLAEWNTAYEALHDVCKRLDSYRSRPRLQDSLAISPARKTA